MLFIENFAAQRLFLSYQIRIAGKSVFFPQQEGKEAETVFRVFRAGMARVEETPDPFILKPSTYQIFI